MTCDNLRPCARCIRRNISHLCRDESVKHEEPPIKREDPDPNLMNEHIGSEFNSISEFLDDSWLFSHNSAPVPTNALNDMNPTEQFMVTAADPQENSGNSAESRLRQVIDAKFSAGLLKPFNYVAGYDRLSHYMDSYMNLQSKKRVLASLAKFRPSFRQIAASLSDCDLIVVEEYFERMLLDYDRIFSSVAIPACLWRRTGEIYRGNKEFAELIGCAVDDLRDGKLAIYQVMSEDSTLNYWEKYSSIAFNSDQKAVVSSCALRTLQGRKRHQCCFSFTVIRDKYGIPLLIVGNFIPVM